MDTQQVTWCIQLYILNDHLHIEFYLFSDIWGNLERLGPMRHYWSKMARIIAEDAVIVKGEVRPL